MMSGAYVAKPPVTVEPDLPDGWNPAWPFPGPNPPGYEPDYSLAVTAPESAAVGGTIAVSATLFDHDTHKTRQPDDDSRITWSAAIDGAAVPLRFDGAGEYAASVQSSYSATDGFWGAAPTLDVQLAEEHDGRTLVLTASSTALGEALATTREVEISSTRCLSLEAAWPSPSLGEEGFCLVSVDLQYEDAQWGWSSLAKYTVLFSGGGEPVVNSYPSEPHDGITTSGTGLSATITIDDLSAIGVPGPLRLMLALAAGNVAAESLSATLTMLAGEAVVGTYGAALAVSAGAEEEDTDARYPWLTVDCATGEVTVVNP